jgi:hypothetical protein
MSAQTTAFNSIVAAGIAIGLPLAIATGGLYSDAQGIRATPLSEYDSGKADA